MGDTEESFIMSPLASPTKMKRQDHLKSSIQTLPNDESTKKAFQDRDEKKILQSAHSPRRIQHLTSTFQVKKNNETNIDVFRMNCSNL